MLDSLAGVTDQLHTEFPTVGLDELAELVRRCRREIDVGAPADCIPELVYQVARVRLADTNACPPSGTAVTTGGSRRYRLVQQPVGPPSPDDANRDRLAEPVSAEPAGTGSGEVTAAQ